MKRNKLLLVIMDGVGVSKLPEFNAVKNANTPILNHYLKNYPNTSLVCNGKAVGLPEGVMGNSEVGHLNIGAGRRVLQDLVKIDESFETGGFQLIPEFIDIIGYSKQNNQAIHLMGLLSDAGVHSDVNHLKKILLLLKESGIEKVYVHAITDGRDTPPQSGKNYLSDIINFMNSNNIGKLATISGRYYTMDRDNRWERIEIAYDCLVGAKGIYTTDPLFTITEMYSKGITDEFMEPIIVEHPEGNHLLNNGDAVMTFNFRADRMREIAAALNFDDFDGFERKERRSLFYNTMTNYKEDFPFPYMIKEQRLENILGEIISKNGLHQLRIAETEKYPHVTYFFNGGVEKHFENEDRMLVPSPKVATYDLQPEMSAIAVTDKLLEAIKNNLYDVIILNFANGDMVGHTGVFDAAVKAVETVDAMLGKIVPLMLSVEGSVLITADHGNAEEMWDYKNNQPHTQHSMNKVPFIIITPDNKYSELKQEGALCDIAPTILYMLNIPVPDEMTGKSLIVK